MAGHLELLEDGILNLGHVDELLKVPLPLEAILARKLLQTGFCGEDNGQWPMLLGGCIDADVGDDGSGTVDGFKLGPLVRCHDHVHRV